MGLQSGLHGCYKVVKRVFLQGCYRACILMLQGHGWISQGFYNGITCMLLGCSMKFTGVLQ